MSFSVPFRMMTDMLQLPGFNSVQMPRMYKTFGKLDLSLG